MVRGPWTIHGGPRAVGPLETPWAQFFWVPRDSMGQKMAHGPKVSPTWPGPFEGVQENQDPGLPKVEGDALDSLVMSSKLTEIPESSPSALPPSVPCGSGIFSRFSSPSMASFGHFDPSQTYDGYRSVEAFVPACSAPSSNVRRYLWSRKYGPFGKEFPVSEAPTPDGTSGFTQLTGPRQRHVARSTNVGGPIPVGGRTIYSSSDIPISRINSEGVVKRIRRISYSPTDPDAEGSDELDGEEVEVVPHFVGHSSSNSSAQPLANRVQSQVLPITPRTFQPVLASIPTTIPPSSPSTSHSRPAMNPATQERTHNHLPTAPAYGQFQ
ncbi:hypothetical protein O181_076286 [Austropuccinia psidii MF-1]|uniref:Uncharacterized protein n=1 Tax=Austropuccinia psidii MF-1 TaxID=1389203 RepID=A0A9Q3FFZ1_9BASI|nr:hypothetical protein [Austropuccinia psidii MF-1]